MLGSTAECNDLVSDDCRKQRDFHDNKEREKRKNTHTRRSVGSVDAKIRHDLQGLPTCPTPQMMIVDFETFEIEDHHYIKELAFYNPFQMHHWVSTFQSPFTLLSLKKSFRNKVENQQFDLHGLEWGGGLLPYTSVFQVLYSFASNCTLYTQNSEKSRILQHLTNCTILDLDYMDIPPVYELPFGSYCYFHDSSKFSCALDKAIRIGQYYKDNFFKTSYHDNPCYNKD